MQLIIPFEPVAQGRPRLTTRGRYAHAYDPPKSKEYKNKVRTFAEKEMEGNTPLKEPLALTIYFYRSIPKHFNKKKTALAERQKVYPKTKPDVDNYVKGLLDALNGVIWNDDNQIIEIVAKKRYSTTPRTEVLIETLEEES